MCLNRNKVSLTYSLPRRAHSGPRSSTQPWDKWVSAMSGYTFPGYGYRFGGNNSISYPRETGDFRGLSGTLLSVGDCHIKMVHTTLGTNGSNGTNSPIGPFLGTALPCLGCPPTDAAASQIVSHQCVTFGSPLVETPKQSCQMEQAGYL